METGSQKSQPQLQPQAKTYAQKLEDYYRAKLGSTVAPIALLKTLAVISADFKENVKFWILHVAPSRQLKSKTNEEQQTLFSKKKVVYVGSDFTIHGLIAAYGNKVNGKCLLINDLTLLLASKADRTRARLIDALAELASEGRYKYIDFQKNHEIKARFSLITGIVPQSYLRNKKDLLGNTFTERCLIVYHQLSEQDMSEANLNRAKRNAQKIDKVKLTVREQDVAISKEDEVKFDAYARRWRRLGAYTSSSALFDMIKSVAIAYAVLAGHKSITADEYKYIDTLEGYVRSPFEGVKLKILDLAYQGMSVEDICYALSKNPETYRSFVARTVKEYRQSGVLPWEP